MEGQKQRLDDCLAFHVSSRRWWKFDSHRRRNLCGSLWCLTTFDKINTGACVHAHAHTGVWMRTKLSRLWNQGEAAVRFMSVPHGPSEVRHEGVELMLQTVNQQLSVSVCWGGQNLKNRMHVTTTNLSGSTLMEGRHELKEAAELSPSQGRTRQPFWKCCCLPRTAGLIKSIHQSESIHA